MSNTNIVILSGRLERDPELRFTPGGKAIAEFTLASGQKFKNAQGEDKETTAWIGCSVFGPRAEFAGKYLKKGLRTNLQGQLVTEEWEDKQTGQKRSKTKVKVTNIEPIDWPDKAEKQQPTNGQDVPF
jgi:single-strand DNA-binding protein